MSNLPNPFSDFWDFVIGNTDDYNALGVWKYLLVVLFLALIVASVVIAIKN
ncbi:MAG: DoxX family protein, partial [Hyphomicrobiales bacterium]|nr:DoxX family protein [Hyphomicrobiales bacterium]